MHHSAAAISRGRDRKRAIRRLERHTMVQTSRRMKKKTDLKERTVTPVKRQTQQTALVTIKHKPSLVNGAICWSRTDLTDLVVTFHTLVPAHHAPIRIGAPFQSDGSLAGDGTLTRSKPTHPIPGPPSGVVLLAENVHSPRAR